jgi:16S rRNA processing protein RimM
MNNAILSEQSKKSEQLEQYVSVAQIIATYSIKGQFFVKTHQTHPQESVLHNIKTCFICKSDIFIHNNNHSNIKMDIIAAKLYKDGILLLSQQFTTPEALKPYIGYHIMVNRSDFPSTKKDEFYWSDLLHKQVINTNNQILGIVERMMDNGVQSILCIHPKPQAKFSEEILIPFTSTYIVDVNASQIIVNWDESYV